MNMYTASLIAMIIYGTKFIVQITAGVICLAIGLLEILISNVARLFEPKEIPKDTKEEAKKKEARAKILNQIKRGMKK